VKVKFICRSTTRSDCERIGNCDHRKPHDERLTCHMSCVNTGHRSACIPLPDIVQVQDERQLNEA